MKKNIPTAGPIAPMPVLIIATYNEDGTVNAMNAAWGTMLEPDHVILNLTETHKTVENLKARKAFTVSLADAAHLVAADYFGIASGHTVKDKLTAAGLTAVKSTHVDAPIINEFPVCMECEFIEFQADTYGCGVIGKIVNTCAEESALSEGKVDLVKAGVLAFDPFTAGYFTLGRRVGNAFKDGTQLK